ncbi:MAG: oligosaccharide flippase family protein [Deltaproteobacteria bacterium]|nr:oligosaccharide flippase family protein [Deltaproteobacteria bacterium]
MATVRTDEGRRVLRNVTSFGAFLFAPLHMALMARALGQDGYGRWWGAFVVLEAAAMVGMLSAELFVRREVPRLDEKGRSDEVHSVIGSALVVVGVLGVALMVLQIGVAGAIASAHDDPALTRYIVVLSVQPVLLNLSTVLSAALQSRDVLGPVAVLRGLVLPIIVAGVLWVGWRGELSSLPILWSLVAVTALGLAVTIVLYARHFSLRSTLRHIVAPRRAGAVVRFGLGLLLPVSLFAVAAKVDVYLLGEYVPAAQVGMYAACLQMASMLPNIRALFDPIAQNQIAALEGRDNSALGASLRRLTRMCAFSLAPIFIVLLSVGQPIMSILLGHDVSAAVVPLAILGIGQLLGAVALASWMVSMTMGGRYLTYVAAVSLAVKLGLLLSLTPSFGLVGAAIATAVTTIIAQCGQAWLGGRRLRERVYATGTLAVLGVSAALAYGGRFLFGQLTGSFGDLAAGTLAGLAAVVAFAIVAPALLTSAERARARAWISTAFRRSARLRG